MVCTLSEGAYEKLVTLSDLLHRTSVVLLQGGVDDSRFEVLLAFMNEFTDASGDSVELGVDLGETGGGILRFE